MPSSREPLFQRSPSRFFARPNQKPHTASPSPRPLFQKENPAFTAATRGFAIRQIIEI